MAAPTKSSLAELAKNASGPVAIAFVAVQIFNTTINAIEDIDWGRIMDFIESGRRDLDRNAKIIIFLFFIYKTIELILDFFK